MDKHELVVADTTVWSNFSHTGTPKDVAKIYPGVSSPPQVLAEIQEAQQLGYLPKIDWSWLPTIQLRNEERQAADEFTRKVDVGEAACIALAHSRRLILLTDDRAARRLADTLNIRVSGTLGILMRLIEMGHLSQSEADDQLHTMIAAGYRSPVLSLGELP